MKHSLLLAADLRWRVAGPLCRHRFPLPIRPWLEESGSLTACLEEKFGPVRVTVLYEGRGRLLPSERMRLGLNSKGWIWVREVLLKAHGFPLVAARTVAPISTLKGVGTAFAHLGNRPLGELLFTHPEVERGAMEWVRLHPRDWAMVNVPYPPWGRRTLYSIGGRPLLVNEFFLPGVPGLEMPDAE